jgi:hypothetical protein
LSSTPLIQKNSAGQYISGVESLRVMGGITASGGWEPLKLYVYNKNGSRSVDLTSFMGGTFDSYPQSYTWVTMIDEKGIFFRGTKTGSTQDIYVFYRRDISQNNPPYVYTLEQSGNSTSLRMYDKDGMIVA